jgi:hypothetical protein
VPVHRFSCGLDGHLCTFPRGLLLFEGLAVFNSSLIYFTLIEVLLCAVFGELTNYKGVLTDQSSPDYLLTGLLFKQLHVRVDIADYYFKVSACWLKLLLPSSERDLFF